MVTNSHRGTASRLDLHLHFWSRVSQLSQAKACVSAIPSLSCRKGDRRKVARQIRAGRQLAPVSPVFLVASGYRDDRDLVFQDCSGRVSSCDANLYRRLGPRIETPERGRGEHREDGRHDEVIAVIAEEDRVRERRR